MNGTQAPPRAHDHPRTGCRAELLFLLAWIAIPLAMRLVRLVWLVPAGTPLSQASVSVSWAAVVTLPQDLAIAVEVLVAVVGCRWLLTRTVGLSTAQATFVMAPAVAGLFAIVHLYLLVDFLLFAKTGIRMDYSFLSFLFVFDSMLSSAEALGLWMLLAGGAALLAVTWQAERLFRRSIERLRTSGPMLALASLTVALAGASMFFLSADLSYAINNAVLNDEWSMLRDVAWRGAALEAFDERLARQCVEPRGERFTRLSSRFPLLKRTEGFTGEKRFDVQIDPVDRPHVLILFMESFRAADVGVLGGKHQVSPCFDRLSREGVLFTRFYGTGVQTTRGAISSLYGILPRFSTISEQAGLGDLPLCGLPDILQQQGYRTAYFSAGNLNFENQRGFFPAHGFQELHGQDEFAAAFPKGERTSWGIHDEYLMRYLADWLSACDQRRQRAFMAAFTISNHHPWKLPQRHRPPPVHVPADSEYARMLGTFHYSDSCLGLLVDLLRQRGLDKKTLLVILADTATPMGEHHKNFMLCNYLYEENVHIPLLILAPGRLQQPAVIDALGSQIDLLPTLLDLLRIQSVNHGHGTSLARRVAKREVYFNNPFALQYVGLRRDDWKYIFELRSRTSSLYRLSDDPGETRNLAKEHPELVTEFRARAMAANQYLTRLYLERRFTANDEVPSPIQNPKSKIQN
jgi:phosphoglycerol transferase MdoB-like AlkP superfamily enzyme